MNRNDSHIKTFLQQKNENCEARNLSTSNRGSALQECNWKIDLWCRNNKNRESEVFSIIQ